MPVDMLFLSIVASYNKSKITLALSFITCFYQIEFVFTLRNSGLAKTNLHGCYDPAQY